MESIIAMALEYTLKYWLRSFSRDQFKLQGRTGRLSNLDINGEALHASIGLPPALHVATARVGVLEITLPSMSNVNIEPFLVQIDRLDIVLEEKAEFVEKSPVSSQGAVASNKGGGYGLADKIADGMTVEVGIVNLLLETRGARRKDEAATWSPPIAAITIRNLVLYTTNENWQVVNLKEARDFSANTGFIYVFKKLEWRSLSIDLLPHPDMFTDPRYISSRAEDKRDDDGAKRMFFGGEKFLDGISGEANITVQRSEQNRALGLEVQLHITEAVCPALSEPGLRAFLRFLTGLDVCLNRGDVGPKAQQNTEAESAGSSMVSMLIDHIFFCIKDAEFQLELLMQSLFFSRGSSTVGDSTKNLTCIKVGGLFLRDTFSHPPCTLIQPSMRSVTLDPFPLPKFVQSFCPPIYPFGNQLLQYIVGEPLFSMYSLQINPAPSPPKLASQTVMNCQPLTVTLQEKSCLRIASFLADRVVVNNKGIAKPDLSVNSILFALKECELSIPLDAAEIAKCIGNQNNSLQPSLVGARLQIKELFVRQSPSAKCTLLNLEKDPACFSLWESQSVDASQRKWEAQLSTLSLLLETSNRTSEAKGTGNLPEILWKCVEFKEVRIEAAMVTADGGPMLELPPPEGIVRVGLACQNFVTNTSVEQLFFVLALYNYFGQVGERISKVRKDKKDMLVVKLSSEKDAKKLPSDTAISLRMNNLQLNFLDSFSEENQRTILVQYGGENMFLKVSHRILGGAFAVSTNLLWKAVYVNCLDDGALIHENGIAPSGEHGTLSPSRKYQKMRAVFWVDNRNKSTAQFLDIDIAHVMPFNMQDSECHSLHVSAKISGVRLGGGMGYTEALLHRFGILGPDGGPGEELLRGLNDLSNGPLAKLFKTSAFADKHECQTEPGNRDMKFDIGMPDDLDVSIELRSWLFALEGAEQIDSASPSCNGDISREEKCWHTTFRNFHLSGKSSETSNNSKISNKKTIPVEFFKVGVDGLQAIKPRLGGEATQEGANNLATNSEEDGIDVETTLVVSSDDLEEIKWSVENIKFAVKHPIEAIATKDELEHLLVLCRSEIDSMGRIAAGILRLLKLDKSLGQSAVEQLGNLGSEGLERIFTPIKHSRNNSSDSISLTPKSPLPNSMLGSPKDSMESAVASLDAEIMESQSQCAALISEMSHIEDPKYADGIARLSQKLNTMQALLTKLRTQV